MSKKRLTFLFLLVIASGQLAFGMKKIKETEKPVEEIKLIRKLSKMLDCKINRFDLYCYIYSTNPDLIGLLDWSDPNFPSPLDPHFFENTYDRIFHGTKAKQLSSQLNEKTEKPFVMPKPEHKAIRRIKDES